VSETNPIVGVWELQGGAMVASDGTESSLWGEGAAGFLIYTVEGYFSEQLMQAGRKPFTAPDLRSGSTEEKAHAAETYVAYSGKYSSAPGSVTHHPAVHLFPNLVGVDQPRGWSIEGDILTLTTPKVKRGPLEYHARIRFERR
jgi:hypothetical protein